MRSDELERIRALQQKLNRLQHELNELLLGGKVRERKLTLERLEIRVSEAMDAIARRPTRAARRPV